MPIPLTGAGLPYDQAFALLLAAGTLRSLAGTALGEAIDLATQKLRSGLSESSIRYCERLVETFKLVDRARVDYGDHAGIIEQILLGHEDQKNVFITYHSRRSTEPATYRSLSAMPKLCTPTSRTTVPYFKSLRSSTCSR